MYEDDDEIKVKKTADDSAPKLDTAEERHKLLIPKYSTAIAASYKALRRRIHSMDVDSYVADNAGIANLGVGAGQQRGCLPYTIGSPQFMQSETAGLARRPPKGGP